MDKKIRKGIIFILILAVAFALSACDLEDEETKYSKKVATEDTKTEEKEQYKEYVVFFPDTVKTFDSRDPRIKSISSTDITIYIHWENGEDWTIINAPFVIKEKR